MIHNIEASGGCFVCGGRHKESARPGAVLPAEEWINIVEERREPPYGKDRK